MAVSPRVTYTAEQTAENRAKLVAALRSGEYEQGEGSLRRGNKYCCLGVACVLAHRENVVDEEQYAPDAEDHPAGPLYKFGGKDSNWESAYLPEEVMHWLGVASDDGHLTESYTIPNSGHYTVYSLASANDSGHMDFNAIADLIEQGKVELREE